jgi:prepilin-type N-terminal cleavage/methylation domain-containing protein
MKRTTSLHQHRGFSLMELLMAVAVISMLAAIGMFTLSSVMDEGQQTVARKNAQSFSQIVAAARAAGAEFHSTTKEGMLSELIAGVNGAGQFSHTKFQLNVQGAARASLLKLCTLDAAGHIVVQPA